MLNLISELAYTQKDITITLALSLGSACIKGKVAHTAKASIPFNDWGELHSDFAYDKVHMINAKNLQKA